MFARSLKTTFTAGLLATSLALATMTPTSAAARMSDEEIAALLGLLVIGAAIHNNRNNDRTETPAPSHPRPNRNWQVLPSQCLTTVESRRGQTVRMFGQRCLNRNYQYTNRLPAACHVQFRSENGNRRQGYRARCMRNQGFRTSRH